MGVDGSWHARVQDRSNSGSLMRRFVAMLKRRPTASGVGKGPLQPLARLRQMQLLSTLRCPTCHLLLTMLGSKTLTDGRVKAGTLYCETCGHSVAEIRNFQVTFLEIARISRDVLNQPPRSLGNLGERRISGPDPAVVLDRWDAHADCWTSNALGATVTFSGICTDIRIRILEHQTGGDIEVSVDGSLVATLSTIAETGSVSRIIDISTDLEPIEHELTVSVTGLESRGAHVILQEIVLFGPIQRHLLFTEPTPFSRGNPHGERIETFINSCDESQLVLECGGGDRRPDRANVFNLEYLPYEGPDLKADLHRLPFSDNTFDLVFSQAVFEHLSHPHIAAQEMIRVCKQGGLLLAEVAFMQPLHAVPYHFYNMTTWGVAELFRESCVIEELDWFGSLSFTMGWLLDASGVAAKLGTDLYEDWKRRFETLDPLIDHESLKAVASGVWLVARKQ